jgi:hypothetical protein
LPSTDIYRLLVTPELVADPKAELERLLADPDNADLGARQDEAAKAERLDLLRMVAKREPLYRNRLRGPLTPARMDLIADEYYRVGMTLGTAFDVVLDRLDEIRDFEESFFQRYSLRISFTEAAEVAILASAAAEGTKVVAYLQRLSQILEPGLRLARDRTGREAFVLPEEAVFDTDAYLREVFQEHFQTTLSKEI